MNSALLVFTVVACLFASSAAQCALGGGPSAQPGLTLCVEYQASSCCSPTVEQQVIANMAVIQQTYGYGNCTENLRRVSCAFTCAPANGAFVTATLSPYALTGTFNAAYIDGVYNSCKDRCANPPYTFSFVYGTNSSAWFVAQSSTSTNPSIPSVYFRVSSAGTAFNGTFLPPSSDDLLGCPTTTGSTTGSNAHSAAVAFAASAVFVLVSALVALLA